MTVKKINLALQGGGAHGAFTWGVLDRVLQDERIEIAAMSGTSAGALNAAALKAGMVRDGRTGAREALDWLWTKIAGSDGDSMAQWLTPFGPAGVSRAIELVTLCDGRGDVADGFTLRLRSPLQKPDGRHLA